ncbi:MAG: type II toxin-antitoxin system RatA family toxin [Candidatus Accumulibacter sp.]|jgi:ribosome-associated toxin RatA of RatAB toxin-antitoxin module|nr:type II toxin-antitoxin system RatA family toxin [Accumulibacter sp.]
MSGVEKSLLIEHSAQRMFDLVEDVESYPLFLPWCGATRVDYRDERRTVATLHINFHGVKAHFTTENAKENPAWMTMKLLSGPFRRLEGGWRFKSLAENACKVEFQISYEFSNKLFEKIIGPVFNQIANTFVEAFVKRARQVYGAPGG